MQNSHRTIIRYSISFKQQVIRELEAGSNVAELRRRYGIKGIGTIPGWLRKFGKHHLLNKVVRIETMEEKDRIKALEAEVKRLKLALADAVLARECLEVVIDEANKEYKTDLKKNFGDQGSTDSGKGTA
jgi:transposase-like protein